LIRPTFVTARPTIVGIGRQIHATSLASGEAFVTDKPALSVEAFIGSVVRSPVALVVALATVIGIILKVEAVVAALCETGITTETAGSVPDYGQAKWGAV